MTTAADLTPGRPLVFRNATVLTMDDAHRVLQGADVLVTGDQVAAVGQGLAVPEGAAEIDAAGGILMPGMIDTHRHMWQTAMRGYGADWTLTQYFVWYYLQWGKVFRPQDIYAGNLLAALEAVDAGVTTTVDWSHGLQTVEHAEAAADALGQVPARFVLAYGNIQAGPWEWATAPEFRGFVGRRFGSGDFSGRDSLLGFQMAFDVTGDPEFPERAAFEVARELGAPVTTHAGVWGATNDDGIRLMHENGFMTASTIYVHAATLTRDSYHRIAATGGSASVSTESEQSAGQGYPPTWRLREHSIPVSLSMDTSVWWSRGLVLGDAGDAGRGPVAGAPGGARPAGDRHPRAPARRGRGRVGHPRRRRGAGPGLGDGQHRAGEEGRPGADQERRVAGDVPGAPPVRARGVPGPARRRAHRRRQRPGAEVPRTGSSAPTWPAPASSPVRRWST